MPIAIRLTTLIPDATALCVPLMNLSIVTRLCIFFRICVLAALSMVILPGSISAAELIMIEQEDCVYCERFNRQIAPAYPKTTEGKLAPLRRVDLADKWPANLSNVTLERFTPTFILVENNQEFSRIRGYPGDEYFWFLLQEMLDDMQAKKSAQLEKANN